MLRLVASGHGAVFKTQHAKQNERGPEHEEIL